MPLCQGLPDGPCPKKKNDASVKVGEETSFCARSVIRSVFMVICNLVINILTRILQFRATRKTYIMWMSLQCRQLVLKEASMQRKQKHAPSMSSGSGYAAAVRQPAVSQVVSDTSASNSNSTTTNKYQLVSQIKPKNKRQRTVFGSNVTDVNF